MCSHSAPPLIIRLHSAVSWPKSEARTEGEMMARGIVVVCVRRVKPREAHRRPPTVHRDRRHHVPDVGGSVAVRAMTTFEGCQYYSPAGKRLTKRRRV